MRRRASIHDRGNKLWHGSRFVLPEHREAMLVHDRLEQRQARPSLDQDKLEEMNRVLTGAMETGRSITVTVYKPYGNETIALIPKQIDFVSRKLKAVVADDTERLLTVPLDDLIDIGEPENN